MNAALKLTNSTASSMAEAERTRAVALALVPAWRDARAEMEWFALQPGWTGRTDTVTIRQYRRAERRLNRIDLRLASAIRVHALAAGFYRQVGRIKAPLPCPHVTDGRAIYAIVSACDVGTLDPTYRTSDPDGENWNAVVEIPIVPPGR